MIYFFIVLLMMYIDLYYGYCTDNIEYETRVFQRIFMVGGHAELLKSIYFIPFKTMESAPIWAVSALSKLFLPAFR